MPNKKRRAKNAPALDFELEPTTLAKTTNLSGTKSRLHENRKRKSYRTFENEDDTPKAFARLMAFASGARKIPKCLDDGLDKGAARGNNKQKRTTDTAPEKDKKPNAAEQLRIQPSESLREFNRRVDASLPVTIKVPHEARNPKKQLAPAVSEQEVAGGDYSDGEGGRRKRRRGKSGRREASPDPWAGLMAKREAPKFGDVAKAPPSLLKPKAVLHTRGIADVEGVPKAAGSLAKREGLAVERRGVVEAYRKMIQERRGEEGLD